MKQGPCGKSCCTRITSWNQPFHKWIRQIKVAKKVVGLVEESKVQYDSWFPISQFHNHHLTCFSLPNKGHILCPEMSTLGLCQFKAHGGINQAIFFINRKKDEIFGCSLSFRNICCMLFLEVKVKSRNIPIFVLSLIKRYFR